MALATALATTSQIIPTSIAALQTPNFAKKPKNGGTPAKLNSKINIAIALPGARLA